MTLIDKLIEKSQSDRSRIRLNPLQTLDLNNRPRMVLASERAARSMSGYATEIKADNLYMQAAGLSREASLRRFSNPCLAGRLEGQACSLVYQAGLKRTEGLLKRASALNYFE